MTLANRGTVEEFDSSSIHFTEVTETFIFLFLENKLELNEKMERELPVIKSIMILAVFVTSLSTTAFAQDIETSDVQLFEIKLDEGKNSPENLYEVKVQLIQLNGSVEVLECSNQVNMNDFKAESVCTKMGSIPESEMLDLLDRVSDLPGQYQFIGEQITSAAGGTAVGVVLGWAVTKVAARVVAKMPLDLDASFFRVYLHYLLLGTHLRSRHEVGATTVALSLLGFFSGASLYKNSDRGQRKNLPIEVSKLLKSMDSSLLSDSISLPEEPYSQLTKIIFNKLRELDQ